MNPVRSRGRFTKLPVIRECSILKEDNQAGGAYAFASCF